MAARRAPLHRGSSRRRRARSIFATASHRAIVVTGLRNSFGQKVVLHGIDLHIAEGTAL
jgi:hypothetical protein